MSAVFCNLLCKAAYSRQLKFLKWRLEVDYLAEAQDFTSGKASNSRL